MLRSWCDRRCRDLVGVVEGPQQARGSLWQGGKGARRQHAQSNRGLVVRLGTMQLCVHLLEALEVQPHEGR